MCRGPLIKVDRIGAKALHLRAAILPPHECLHLLRIVQLCAGRRWSLPAALVGARVPAPCSPSGRVPLRPPTSCFYEVLYMPCCMPRLGLYSPSYCVPDYCQLYGYCCSDGGYLNYSCCCLLGCCRCCYYCCSTYRYPHCSCYCFLC